jgi:hypothetical protein
MPADISSFMWRSSASLFFSAILGIALLSVVVGNAQSGADKFPSGDLHMSTDNQDATKESSRDCATQFATFVKELDKVLAGDPETIAPVYDLLHKIFPVERCNVDEVIKTARQSLFFVGVSDEGTYYVIVFNSKDVSRRPCFYVQVSLVKATGNSRLPFVKVNGY